MKKAFTLVEILFSCVVLMVLIGGIVVMLNSGNKGWSTEIGLLNLHRQARQAMHGMVRETRQSQPSDITITNAGARIQFEIPQDLFSGATSYYQPIDYFLNNGQIIREHPTGTTEVLANDIKTLNFCFWDGVDCCDPDTEDCSNLDILEISLEVEKTIRQRVLFFSIREEVKLRNE